MERNEATRPASSRFTGYTCPTRGIGDGAFALDDPAWQQANQPLMNLLGNTPAAAQKVVDQIERLAQLP